MSAVDTNFYERKKTNTFYWAVVFLVCVIALTWGLYYYSYTLSDEITNNTTTLSQLESSISEIQQDEKVQLYSVYAQNKVIFDTLAAQSKIPSMINHLIRVFAIQGIEYKGFDYSNGQAQIDLSLETNDSGYAYEKVIKFLNTYRENEEALFTISQVSNFDWYDKIDFTADFILK